MNGSAEIAGPAAASPAADRSVRACGIGRRTFLSGMVSAPVLLLIAQAPRAYDRAIARTPLERRQMIIQVLEDAQASGNMYGAIERYGHSLTVDEKRILMSLSAEELWGLRSARAKLSRGAMR